MGPPDSVGHPSLGLRFVEDKSMANEIKIGLLEWNDQVNFQAIKKGSWISKMDVYDIQYVTYIYIYIQYNYMLYTHSVLFTHKTAYRNMQTAVSPSGSKFPNE